jgi:hypothetical protein
MNLMSKFWIFGGLAFILATTTGCSPRNLEDCLADASKAPTEQGVNVAASGCYRKFGTDNNKRNDGALLGGERKVRDVCHVYWDGVRWQKGRTEGDDFSRYSRSQYGVAVVHFSIPKEVERSFGISKKIGEETSDPEFIKFLNKYWYQVESICDLK